MHLPSLPPPSNRPARAGAGKPACRRFLAAAGAVALLVSAGCTSTSQRQAAAREARLAGALTFHAGFDGTADAGYARGDRRIQHGPQWGKPRDVVPGLPAGGVVRVDAGAGRHGDALRFEKKIPQLVAYLTEGNLAYRTNGWSGTVSFWLRVDPETDLEPGYCDTIQITSKDWNDAAFFTEFTKDEKPREFRLGAYADPACWNPQNRKWDDMAFGEKPLIKVERPPFSRERWTHVVFTWEKFNTGKANGITRLYLDGELKGELSPREQTWTWNPDETLVMLGLSYTGWMDDLA
ncbi:MAG: LamG-like jellyroll fold domain-containing protein, partial [Verrucomicrobiota bacterium]